MATIIQPLEKRHLDSIKAPEAPTNRPPRQCLGATLRRIHLVAWVLLVTAVMLFNLFAYQVFLAPQTRDYQPNWYGAHWIRASDASGAVSYYRKLVSLEAPPSGAFLTIQGLQTYTL